VQRALLELTERLGLLAFKVRLGLELQGQLESKVQQELLERLGLLERERLVQQGLLELLVQLGQVGLLPAFLNTKEKPQ
jgi:hypothetical protein